MASVPHLKIPFRIGAGGKADVLEQDSFAEIAQCVRMVVVTRQGERVEVPEYGVADPVFGTAGVLASLSTAIQLWEPRARVDVQVHERPDHSREVRIGIATQVDALPSGGVPGGQPGSPTLPDIGGGSTWDQLGTITWDELGNLTWGDL